MHAHNVFACEVRVIVASFPRRAALEKWKQRLGSKATYNELIGVFERAGHKDYTDTVRRICGKSHCG